MSYKVRKRQIIEKSEKNEENSEHEAEKETKKDEKEHSSKSSSFWKKWKIVVFLLILTLIFFTSFFLISDKSKKIPSEPKVTKQVEELHPFDKVVQQDLNGAQKLLKLGKLDDAKLAFEQILRIQPLSTAALYGYAQSLDLLADYRRNNQLLDQAIRAYSALVDLEITPPVPKKLLYDTGTRLVDRLTFRGMNAKAVEYQKKLTEHFPGNNTILNGLGVAYLLSKQNEEARKVFLQVLQRDPTDGFALVHVGFIIKTNDNNPKEAIEYLEKGIATNASGTKDGRFYFNLGDAYQRTNQTDKAYQLYGKGVELGLFKSLYQRSLYNVDRLTARPWWTAKQTGYMKHLKTLQDNWKIIRDEAIAQMDFASGLFRNEEENLREKGSWQQYTLYAQGVENSPACRRVPETCTLVARIADAAGCRRGQIKFSVMHPGTHVWPHCGPTNCRLRAHLGLRVPKGPKIRVGNVTRVWKEGEFIIFDDSFEHEVWHDGDSFRLVLIIDFWHPELTADEKKNLPAI